MDQIQFISLNDIEEEKLINLMNNETVKKHLPLMTGDFTHDQCRTFLNTKQQLWDNHGYGPWAFIINNEFAGWGGLQEENGDADFALILHPKFWGFGIKIFRKIKDQAFSEFKLSSITALLPPNRPNSKAISRLGFRPDGQVTIDNENFLRFRLNAPNNRAS